MIVTIFRSRLRPDAGENYNTDAMRLGSLVKGLSGYISHKSFFADDGEKVTIVEFESEEALESWRTHADHVAAKRLGVQRYFSAYSVQVCAVQRARAWPLRADGPSAARKD